jgi:type I restriction enzyme, S subunit
MKQNLVRLREIASFIRGLTFKPADVLPFESPDSVACFRTRNIQAELDLSDIWAISSAQVRPDQFLCPGDLLISTANSWNLVGKGCYIPRLNFEATFGGFVSALRPDPGRVDPRYLFRWYTNERVQRAVRACGRQTTNISNLDCNRLLNLPIPLPPLAEQRRIAGILDKADTVRRRRSDAIARTRDLAESLLEHFIQSVHVKYTDLGSICTVIRDGVHHTPQYVPSGIPFVTVTQIASGSLDLREARFISPETHAEYTKRVKPRPGDILVSKDGSIGIPCLIDTDDEFSIFVSVALIRPNREIVHPAFLTEQIRAPFVQRQISAGIKGIAIRHLHLEDFKRLRIALPTLSEQEAFVRRLNRLKALQSDQDRSATSLTTLFLSLQHRAFRGEL